MLEHILQVARAEFDRFGKTGFVGNESLWQLAKRAIERNIERFVDHEIKLAKKYPERHPAYFELCFGTERVPPHDLSSVQEPLVVEGVRLCGKIDRVDIAETGDACIVVDYKTGNAETSWKDVAEGRSFQLPVYWLACEELFFREDRIRCEEAYLYRLCGDYAKSIVVIRRSHRDSESSLAKCHGYIKRYAESIRAAKFPVMPSGSCPGWCEYKDICRYERGRIKRKKENLPAESDKSPPDE